LRHGSPTARQADHGAKHSQQRIGLNRSARSVEFSILEHAERQVIAAPELEDHRRNLLVRTGPGWAGSPVGKVEASNGRRTAWG
jgi:hypothetical protein